MLTIDIVVVRLGMVGQAEEDRCTMHVRVEVTDRVRHNRQFCPSKESFNKNVFLNEKWRARKKLKTPIKKSRISVPLSLKTKRASLHSS